MTRLSFGLRVPAGGELNETGFESEFVEVLRAQTGERVAQGRHHALGDARDRAGVLGDARVDPGRRRLDRAGEGEGRRQALAEFVVKVAGERAALLLLDFEQPFRERGALRRRLRQPFGQIVDGARDQAEFAFPDGVEPAGVISLLQLAQPSTMARVGARAWTMAAAASAHMQIAIEAATPTMIEI